MMNIRPVAEYGELVCFLNILAFLTGRQKYGDLLCFLNILAFNRLLKMVIGVGIRIRIGINHYVHRQLNFYGDCKCSSEKYLKRVDSQPLIN